MQKEMTKPLVSVVIPCYNAAKYVGETIESAYNQNYDNIEIIVVDDGSTDNSAIIIKQLAKQYEKLHYIHQSNAGVSVARNNGIKASSGQFVVPLDADDIMLPENISQKVETAISQNCDLVFSGVQIVDEHLTPIEIIEAGNPENLLENLFVYSPPSIVSPSSTLIRKSVFEQTGLFDPHLSVSADFDMWIRIAINGKAGKVNKPLTLYRQVPGSMNSNINKQILDVAYINNKYKNDPRLKNLLLKLQDGFFYSVIGNGWKYKRISQLCRFTFKFLINRIRLKAKF